MHNHLAPISVFEQRPARYHQGMEIDSERVVVTGRDCLELRPWRVPAPTAGQLRVRIAYSAVSFGDIMLRRHVFGQRPPVAVPGYEVIGTVEAVGPDVGAPRVGDRIAAFIEYGGNARHALVAARDAVVVPDQTDGPRAAAAVLNYATALGMIEAAALRTGDDLLVHGASGGVGTAVLDTARAQGLRALGTVRGTPRRELFAARLFDAGSPALLGDVRAASPGGVRAVFDPRAGRGLWRSRAMVRPGGSLIVFGLSSVAKRGFSATLGAVGTLATLALFRALPGKRTAVFAMDRIYHRQPDRIRQLVERVIDLLASGKTAPIVGAVLPLGQVAEGHQLVERGGVVGKVVIDCR
jgi:NADPH:quinone reductase-like Zn-dependent oxidoreductase